jgi:peptidyl-prolyl cis-trans isomerase C
MNADNIIKVITSIILLGLFPFFSSGCGRSSDAEVLARVGSYKITVGSFNDRIAHLPERYQKVVEKRKKEFLEEVINDTLLYQEALRKGLEKDDDTVKVIEEAKKKILIARLLKDEVDDKLDITQEEVLEVYNGNKEDYMTPEIMRVSHILVQSNEDAEKVLKELERGKDFEDLARAKSVDPTAQRGGDIGYFPRGQLMPEFEDACVKLEVGETSGVVKTKLGYHIIKLTDRRAPQLKPLERVEESIRSKLRTLKRQKIFNALLGGLRKKTKIEINEKALSAEKNTEGGTQGRR